MVHGAPARSIVVQSGQKRFNPVYSKNDTYFFQTREEQKNARLEKEKAKVEAERMAKEAREKAEEDRKANELEEKAAILSGE